MKSASWQPPNPEMWPEWQPKGSLHVQVSPPPCVPLHAMSLLWGWDWKAQSSGSFSPELPSCVYPWKHMRMTPAFTLSPYPQSSLKCCRTAQGQSAGRQQSQDLNSNLGYAKASGFPTLLQSLLSQKPLCVPYPKEHGHLNSLFPPSGPITCQPSA